MMGNGWGMGAGSIWMLLVWLLVLVAVVAVVALLVRSSGGRTSASGGRSAARRILDERYARGEIDEQDYQTRRRRLEEPDG
ncbi:SHOCT domain-containing protein [Ornithinimicrobium sp. CNJ-824]|uniref:SHOCT domain-containing protein n=1 Tax=Ornithinimicrobium sp. CNJ-824 TaxID=1904966 RepID=UPI00096A9F73|nr:SHOCT domain-containing protein [Ornithinimicrobium sp. CNJ-824]